MDIPVGTILTYQFKAQTTLSHPQGSDLEGAVASDLSSAGLTVVDFNVQAPGILTEIGYVGWGYTVQVTMKIKTSVEYADESDVQSICDHYVYVETDKLPQASTISGIKVPGGTDTSTGTDQTPPEPPNKPSNFLDSFSTFLKGAGVGGFLGIGLALVAVVLIISLLTAKKVIPGA